MTKPDISDPYDPQHEEWFKSNPPTDATPIDEAMEYWQKYEELYGTPRDSNARYLMKTFLRCKKEIERLTAERDEARREVCAFVSGRYSKDVVTLDRAAALDEAKMRGWDCFKENKP